MKHRVGYNRLGRKPAHRKSLHRNMVTSLFRHERIRTTKAKAQAIRRTAEKMITRAKIDSVHNRRMVGRDIKDKAVLAKLFVDIAPRYTERPGGYTRILKIGPRPGDAAEMVLLELVSESYSKADSKSSKSSSEGSAKKDEGGAKRKRSKEETKSSSASKKSSSTTSKKEEPAKPAPADESDTSEGSAGASDNAVEETPADGAVAVEETEEKKPVESSDAEETAGEGTDDETVSESDK